MNGYKLCKEVLDHEEGSVEKLLELAGGAECEWLELKASVVLSSEDIEKGEKPADLYWSIANGIIGISNTYGGVVIIGIDDKKNIVPLESQDPRHIIDTHGLETYLRQEIYERVWPANGSWGTKNDFHTDSRTTPNIIEIKPYSYMNGTVAVIFVNPSIPCLRIWKGEVEEIRSRALGGIGKTKEIIGSKDMDKYDHEERQLEVRAPYFDQILDRFMATTKNSNQQMLNWKTIVSFLFLIIAAVFIYCCFGSSSIVPYWKEIFCFIVAGIILFCFFGTSIIPILSGKKVDYDEITNTVPPDHIIVDHPLWTFEWHCVDLGIWWQVSDVQKTCYGDWKLERNRAFSNYRILDPHSLMRCWGWQKQVIPVWDKLKKDLEQKEPVNASGYTPNSANDTSH